MRSGSVRARWAAIGAAVAVSLGGGVVFVANAAGPTVPSSFVPIVPCRLVDTRADGTNVGTRATPLGAGETTTFAVAGTNGNCSIPSTATGVASNVTAVDATVASFITLFPADAAQPVTSNLNTSPGAPPTPNQVTVGLSATGAVKVFNNAGTADLIIDIVGYYQAAMPGPKGDPGAQGIPGPQGNPGVRGFSAWETIPSGVTVTGVDGFSGNYQAGQFYFQPGSLPGVAPVNLNFDTINFAPDSNLATSDDDSACAGTAQAPTAPAGKVCIYLYFGPSPTISQMLGQPSDALRNQTFFVAFQVSAIGPQNVFYSWAYTAP